MHTGILVIGFYFLIEKKNYYKIEEKGKLLEMPNTVERTIFSLLSTPTGDVDPSFLQA